MVKEIDQEVTDLTELRVFHLVNADPSETADQLATLFPDTTTSNSANQNRAMPFFFRGGPAAGEEPPLPTSSERMKKMGSVMAVPDPRTSSIIVMASKTMMPQIADMITELDSDKGRKEVVGFYDLQNADPQDVYNNLQDLFNRVNVRPQNNNANPMIGTEQPDVPAREGTIRNLRAQGRPPGLAEAAVRGGGGSKSGHPGSAATWLNETARQI